MHEGNSIVFIVIIFISVLILVYCLISINKKNKGIDSNKFDNINQNIYGDLDLQNSNGCNNKCDIKDDNMRDINIDNIKDNRYNKNDHTQIFKDAHIDSIKLPERYYFLDDGANGMYSNQYNFCSKSCCSDQWAPPFKLEEDTLIDANKSKFVLNNISCSDNIRDSGCLCLTKQQNNFLYNRGGN